MSVRLMTGILLLLSFVLVGCKEATIVDLIHSETERTENNVSREVLLTEEKYKEYRVGDVLFIPYTRILPLEHEQNYEKYSLELATYKNKESISQVVVNSVLVNGTKDVDLSSIVQELYVSVEFDEMMEEGSLVGSSNTLIGELSKDDMKLTKSSAVDVTLNVSVLQNGKTITEDLHYQFKPRFRTYTVYPT